MSIYRLFRLGFSAALTLLAGAGPLAAADGYPFEIRLSNSSLGEKVFVGEIVPEDGSFEMFVTTGGARVHMSGSIVGDHFHVYAELVIPGAAAWQRFKPFSADGTFGADGIVKSGIAAYPASGTVARGTITVKRPVTALAAAPAEPATPPPSQPAPAAPQATPEPAPQVAVAAPSTPEEPALTNSQRVAIQKQLSVLGLYTSAIDGDFGPGTRKAIRQFQHANRLEATGYLTETTIALLDDKATRREQQLAEQQAQQQALAVQQEAAVQEAARQTAESSQVRTPSEPTPPETTAAAEPKQPAPPAPPPEDDFSAAVASLEPIDASFVAVKPAKVRKQPTVTADLVETLEIGDRIDVLGRLPREDWYLVARNGKPIGYVVTSQLATQVAATTNQPAATPPPAAPQPQPQPQVQVQPQPQAPATPTIPPELAALDYGHYYALVIGNDGYKKLPKLKTAVDDAKAVAAALQSEYGFTVSLLTDASEEQIIGALAEFRRTLTAKDNLLIYYAGHGWYDEGAERGYWLPVDAVADNQAHWISNADVTDVLKAMQAKHVLVVADSCYSGSLTRGLAIGSGSSRYFEDIVGRRARTVLTSGGLEPVLDAGGGGHSVFAKAFLDALRANNAVVDGEGIYHTVYDQVRLNAEQEPGYGNIRLAGHDGGDFLFVRTR